MILAVTSPISLLGFSNWMVCSCRICRLFGPGAKQRKCRLQNCQEGAGVLWCDSNIGARVDGNSLRNKRELWTNDMKQCCSKDKDMTNTKIRNHIAVCSTIHVVGLRVTIQKRIQVSHHVSNYAVTFSFGPFFFSLALALSLSLPLFSFPPPHISAASTTLFVAATSSLNELWQ